MRHPSAQAIKEKNETKKTREETKIEEKDSNRGAKGRQDDGEWVRQARRRTTRDKRPGLEGSDHHQAFGSSGATS
jgi:hypothetical protein